MQRIDVAVGIVFDDLGRVLVGQRVVRDLYYQKWEFPGGKLEANESPTDALIREFREEVGIEVASSEPLMSIEHDYPDRQVRLFIEIVGNYRGTVKALEGQALRWVSINDLRELDFLQGNQPIIDALKKAYPR